MTRCYWCNGSTVLGMEHCMMCLAANNPVSRYQMYDDDGNQKLKVELKEPEEAIDLTSMPVKGVGLRMQAIHWYCYKNQNYSDIISTIFDSSSYKPAEDETGPNPHNPYYLELLHCINLKEAAKLIASWLPDSQQEVTKELATKLGITGWTREQFEHMLISYYSNAEHLLRGKVNLGEVIETVIVMCWMDDVVISETDAGVIKKHLKNVWKTCSYGFEGE